MLAIDFAPGGFYEMYGVSSEAFTVVVTDDAILATLTAYEVALADFGISEPISLLVPTVEALFKGLRSRRGTTWGKARLTYSAPTQVALTDRVHLMMSRWPEPGDGIEDFTELFEMTRRDAWPAIPIRPLEAVAGALGRHEQVSIMRDSYRSYFKAVVR